VKSLLKSPDDLQKLQFVGASGAASRHGNE
jgi:hypothetical protein